MATSPGLTVRLPDPSAEAFLRRSGSHLTRGGLFLTGEEARPPGTPLVLELQLEDGTHLLRAQALVAWVTSAQGPGIPGMGLQFIAVDAPGRRLLEAAVAALPHARSLSPPVPPGAGIPDVRPGALTPAPGGRGGEAPDGQSGGHTPVPGRPSERPRDVGSGGLSPVPVVPAFSPSGLAPGSATGRLDALPHSIGLALPGGHFHAVLPQGSALPARRSFRVSTTRDRQDRLELTVLQGESSRARDNAWLGRFTVEGLPPAPHGGLTVELIFELDEVCLLTLTGIDSVSGREVSARFATRDTPASVRDALHQHQLGAGPADDPGALGSWISRLFGA